MTDSKTVTVYVRLGATKDSRELTFKIPAGISTSELLDKGFAIDGNEAVTGIGPIHSSYNDPEDGWQTFVYYASDPTDEGEYQYPSLASALREEQRFIKRTLKEYSYEVEFA